jgi:hypothetical protein
MVATRLAAAALLLCASALLGGGPSDRPRPGPQMAAAARQPCCFINPQYAGVCVVQPGEGETCASILEYLNNPRSQGKSYCDNTNVRGGWTQVVCPKKDGTASADRRPGR